MSTRGTCRYLREVFACSKTVSLLRSEEQTNQQTDNLTNKQTEKKRKKKPPEIQARCLFE